MGATWLRFAAFVRSHGRRSIPVVLVVALAAGIAMGLATGTRRTASAPDRYTEASGGDYDLALYQESGPPLVASIASLPGVTEVDGVTFTAAFPVAPDGEIYDLLNPFVGEDEILGAQVVDGRFTDPAATDEFTANRAAFDIIDGEIGREYDIRTFSQEQADNNEFSATSSPKGPTMRARLVGLIQSPTDFDDPSPSIIFSDGFSGAYPDVAILVTLMGVRTDGTVSPESIADAMRGMPNGERAFQIPPQVVTEGAREAVSFQARALWIVTLVTAVAAAIVVAQVVNRHVRSTSGDLRALLALGYRPRQMVVDSAMRGGAIALVAAIIAIAIGVAGSMLFPLGAIRQLEPDPGPTLDLRVVALGTLALVLTSAAVAAFRAGSVRSVARRRTTSAPFADTVASAGGSVALTNGVRFALSRPSRRGTPPAAFLAGLALVFAGLLGSLVVASSLRRVIDDPPRFGQNYDQLFGNPFVEAVTDIVTPVVTDPSVRDVAGATLGSLTIDGEDVSVYAYEVAKGSLTPVIVDGEAPGTNDEIALGRRRSRELGRGIGDVVEAIGPTGEPTQLRVVGIVITPNEVGEGAAMLFFGYQALDPAATRRIVLVNWAGEASEETVNRVAALAFSPPDALPTPTTVIALERVDTSPLILAVVLLVLAIATLAQSLVASTREHRKDLAVLHALGARPRLLRRIVHWHAATATVGALVVGVPLGIAVGARVFDLVGDSVGVVSSPLLSPWIVAGTVVGLVVVADLVALWPARRAARIDPDVLRAG